MALLSKQLSFFVIRFHKSETSTLSLDPYEDWRWDRIPWSLDASGAME